MKSKMSERHACNILARAADQSISDEYRPTSEEVERAREALNGIGPESVVAGAVPKQYNIRMK